MAIDLGDFFKEKGEPSEAVLIALAATSLVYALASGASNMTPAIITALAVALSACQLSLTAVVVRLVLRSKIKELDAHNKRTAMLTYVRRLAEERATIEGRGNDIQAIAAWRAKILDEVRPFIDHTLLPTGPES